jgi:phosphoglycolate phosphatase-like HAD superfamily hydrolase
LQAELEGEDRHIFKIAFDFDMTVADSQKGVKECLLQTLFQFQFPAVQDIEGVYGDIRGMKLRDQLQAFSTKLIDSTELVLMEEFFHQIYPSIGVEGTALFPQVPELFDYLKACGSQIMIISAKNSTNLNLSLKRLSLEVEFFQGGLSHKEKSYILKSRDFDTYVGDTKSDVEIARDSGCVSIIINTLNERIGNWAVRPDHSFLSISDFFQWVKIEDNFESLRVP